MSELQQQPVRVGLVGIGRAGWGMHVPAFAARPWKFRIVAACDTIAERRERMARDFGCTVYERVEDLVADASVDLVDIATRSCDHHRHAKLALEGGKHVNLEKPMCASLSEALDLADTARRSPGRLFVHHNRRFEPAFHHVREIMATGVLGEVFEIKLRRVGFQRRDDWQTLKRFGGGQLLNWGPHIIDHALCLLDAPLAAQSSALRRVVALGDAEDHLKIVLTGANGRLVDLEISGAAALSEPEFTVWGSRGALTCDGRSIHLKYLDPARPLEVRVAHPGTPGESEPPDAGDGSRKWSPYVNPEPLHWINETLPVAPRAGVDLASIWDAIYDDLSGGAAFPVTLEQAVNVMRVVDAARAGTEFRTPPGDAAGSSGLHRPSAAEQEK